MSRVFQKCIVFLFPLSFPAQGILLPYPAFFLSQLMFLRGGYSLPASFA